MIVDQPESHFVFVYHPAIFHGEKYTVFQGRPLTNGEVLAYWGKWLVLGSAEKLAELARKLDPYVEARMIPCIKYDRNPPTNLGMEECVMMVYCDRRNRDSVWAILKKHGIRLKAWVTEAETMELWKPGGPLLERWMESRGFGEEMKEAIRNDASMRLSRIVDNPDEEFSPWEQ
ncbi:MAG: hypothetical protein AB1921_04465 [Thermodesulfobacteriota bacterium]